MTMQPGPPRAPPSAVNAVLDAHVRRPWMTKRLTDGTKLDLGRTDREQMFTVKPSGTYSFNEMEAGTQYCADGSERRYAKLKLAAILPNAGGHTHPQGVSGLAGPEDGVMAARTGKPAYVIARLRVFAIEKDSTGYAVRVVAGSKLTAAETAEITSLRNRWGRNSGGSGVKCRVVPD